MADVLISGTTLVEKETRSIGDVPIGTILSFAKSLSGVPTLPSSFVECNGQTLVDANSTLNGTVIPDLNGDNRFLRGAATSGGTGGATSISHDHVTPILTEYPAINQEFSSTAVTNNDDLVRITTSSSQTASGTAETFSNTSDTSVATVPPYYDIVWIMRIK